MGCLSALKAKKCLAISLPATFTGIPDVFWGGLRSLQTQMYLQGMLQGAVSK